MPTNYNETYNDFSHDEIEEYNYNSWLSNFLSPNGLFADADGDPDLSRDDITALSDYFRYGVLSNGGAFYPIRMMLRSLISPFKAYKSPWKIPKDLLQPLWGVGNLCLAVGILAITSFFTIIQAAAQLVLLPLFVCVIASLGAARFISKEVLEIDGSHFGNALIGSAIFALSFPFSIWLVGVPTLFIGMISSALIATAMVSYGILDAATHAVYGAAQIITSPLLVVTMPIRLLMTAINGFEKIEQNKSIVAIVKDFNTENKKLFGKSFSKMLKYMSLNEYCQVIKSSENVEEELLSKYAQKKYDHLVSQGRETEIKSTRPAHTTYLRWLATEVKDHNTEAFEKKSKLSYS